GSVCISAFGEDRQHLRDGTSGRCRGCFSFAIRRASRSEAAFTEGSPVLDICAFAKDHDVDLIITSTHGFAGFTYVLIGSIAEQVVRHAPCSVLVVPSHPHVRTANLAKSAGATTNRLATRHRLQKSPKGTTLTRNHRKLASPPRVGPTLNSGNE